MKIALCFFGLPRLINKCSSDIKEYFGNECDVYAHFWWDESYKGKVNRWHIPERFHNVEDPISLFRNTYLPKKINIEECPNYDVRNTSTHSFACRNSDPFTSNYKTIDYLQPNSECNYCKDVTNFEKSMTPAILYGLYSRHASIIKCIKSMEDIDKYDLVIILRSDLTFIGNQRGSTFINEFSNISLDDNTIFIPSSLWGGPMFAGEHPNRLADWFFVGKPKSVITFFEKALEIITSKQDKIPLHNQERLQYFSILSGITLKMMQSSLTVRRFATEEWEDVSYYNKNLLPSGFIESIFNKETQQYYNNEMAPFFTKFINR